jgi:hypothetical protein
MKIDYNKYYHHHAVSFQGEDEYDFNSFSDSRFSTYDFVVIGGGTVGIVIAS